MRADDYFTDRPWPSGGGRYVPDPLDVARQYVTLAARALLHGDVATARLHMREAKKLARKPTAKTGAAVAAILE